ncbi:MAG TPA: GNAT family N-acetyltransferase [Candidatus Paceibacterota bacterium]|nr:GNAT family N-acetyltransferase [Candidatus Pacearchaeota archaeon]HRZ51484.1 GNAT family N-acetyltransferase [Candidatus Paceibacterota bacterium]HSA37214.1 GNAT family N-acetyltransferase [Candidatus Paceibacterota bacterium]
MNSEKRLRPAMRDFKESDIFRCTKIISETLGAYNARLAKRHFFEGLDLKAEAKSRKFYKYTYLKRKVLVLGDEPIAIGGTYRINTFPEEMMGIDWFAVKKEYQRQGFGTRLVKWSIDDVIRRDKKVLFVWATKKAVSFYDRFDFKRVNLDLKPKETSILLVKKVI